MNPNCKDYFLKWGVIGAFIVLGVVCSSCARLFNWNTQNILVVHSYEETYRPYPDFNKTLVQNLRRNGIHPDMRYFYLNCEMYLARPELQRVYSYLDSLGDWTPDLILVNEDQATYSLLQCGHPLVKQVPVVFAGVTFPNHSLLARYPNATGFRDSLDFMENIRVIEEVTGQSSAFIFVDSTFIDLKIRTALADQLAQFHTLEDQQFPHVADMTLRDWVGKPGLTSDAHVALVSLRKRNTAATSDFFWIISKYGSHNGRYLQVKRDFAVYGIARAIYSPSFTAINESFGYGERLLGGYFASLATQVADQASVAARILKGTPPQDIPMADHKKGYYLDWDVMIDQGISIADLPPNKYFIINRASESNKEIILYAVVSVLVVFLLVFLFMVFLKKKKTRDAAPKMHFYE